MISGQSIDRQFNGSHSFTLTASDVWIRTDSEFDMGCLSDPSRCPDGFYMNFWITISNLTASFVILQTGDCASNVIGDEGFCIFYEKSGMVNFLSNFNGSILQGAYTPATGIETNVLIYFKDINNIHLFLDGEYFAVLKDFSFLLVPLLNVVYTKPILNVYDPSKFDIQNFTFSLGPPGDNVLGKIKVAAATKTLNKSMMFYTSHANFSADYGIGIDGEGLRLSSQAFAKTLFDFQLSNNIDFELGFWLKIPMELGDVFQNLDILSMFDPSGTKNAFVSVSFHPGDCSLMLEMHDVYGNSLNHHMVHQFPISTGAWHHVAITLHSHSFKVYHNGISLPVVATTSISSISQPWKTTLQLGTGMLGFQKVAQSL